MERGLLYAARAFPRKVHFRPAARNGSGVAFATKQDRRRTLAIGNEHEQYKKIMETICSFTTRQRADIAPCFEAHSFWPSRSLSQPPWYLQGRALYATSTRCPTLRLSNNRRAKV